MESKKPFEIDLDDASANLRSYLGFLKLLENLSDDADEYRQLIHDAVEFREFPNLLNEHGQVRNLETSLAGVKKAQMILSEQNYAITGVVEDGEKLAVEKIWTGRMSMDIGGLKKGQELKAYIFAVVEFKDGKIYRHRTYDCYEPFE